MPNFVIFQVNPQTQYHLSDALRAMKQRNEKTLWLNPEPETNEGLKAKDVVYLWESASKKPDRPGHLMARGEVAQAPAMPMDMPAWQRTFCVDKATGQCGPQFHSTMPRAEIMVELLAERKVERDHTDANPISRMNSFLKKRGYYSKTIFSLTGDEVRELDKLAGWVSVAADLS
jgi:hypothetical protein